MMWGNADTTAIHHIIRSCTTVNCNGGGAYATYFMVGVPSPQWTTAYANADSLPSPGTTPPIGGVDYELYLDAADSPYYVSEGHNWPTPEFIAEKLIAFKDASNWAENVRPVAVNDTSVAGGILAAGGISPEMTVHEPATGDTTLHLMYHVADAGIGPGPGWYYSSHDIRDDRSVWAQEARIAGAGNGGRAYLDDADTLHVINYFNDKFAHGQGDSLYFRVFHRYGDPPAPGDTANWIDGAAVDPLWSDSTWVDYSVGLEGEDEDTGSWDLMRSVDFDNYTYVTWSQPKGFHQGIWICRIDKSDHTSGEPLQLDPGNPSGANAPSLVRAGDTWHLMYAEPPVIGLKLYQTEPNSARFWHQYTTGDPADPETAWSPRTDVTSDRINSAYTARYVARAESVWVNYALHDTPDSMWQVFAREGWAIPDTIPAGGSAVWNGQVFLDADFKIADGCTLTIEPNTTIYAEPTDNRNLGDVAGKIELIVEGKLEVNGTPDSRVMFRSTVGTGDDDWAGIRFTGTDEPGECDVEYAHIANAMIGAQIDSVSGNLFHVSFESNEQDIYLPDDTRIGRDAKWGLEAGTRVYANTSSTHDWPWGTEDKVDLIVQGKLFTYGTSDAGSSVYFAPSDTATSGGLYTCEDWGGIGLWPGSEGSELEYADVGFAANPLFLYYPDSLTTVRSSSIHHFAEIGVWAYGAAGPDGVVESCTIERGAGIVDTLGTVGAFLDQTDAFQFVDNTVDLAGLYYDHSGIGLAVTYGKTYCQTASAGADTLTIEGNEITGTGEDTGNHVGMKFDWVCGESDREVLVLENYVGRWNKYGIELLQDSDVQFSCNNVEENPRAVQISRDEEAEGIGLRFRENRLVSLTQGEAALRSDNAEKTRLGGQYNPSDKGFNRLTRWEEAQDPGFFLFEDDTSSAEMHAQYNAWFWEDEWTSGRSTDSVDIVSAMKPTNGTPGDVDVRVAYADEDTLDSCWPQAPAQEEGARAGRPQAEAPDSRVSGAEEGIVVPLATSLGLAWPNPSRGFVRIELAISAERGGPWKAVVYDVSGRRVATPMSGKLAPGYHTVVWSGRNSEGNRVSPGIYFLRVEGPDWRTTRRVVTLR